MSVHNERSESPDTMSYQDQISNISNSNIDYKTFSKHLPNQNDNLKLPGGDITRDLYQQLDSPPIRRTRSSSFSTYLSHSRRESTASDINIPGGFRREFLINKSVQQNQKPPNFLTNNFIEFLSIYGHFAGEDFSDDENYEFEEVFDEESPLLRNHNQTQQTPPTASTLKTFFLVFKSLVGSGVLFLPRAFLNGGLLFSIITLISFGFLTFLCYLTLIKSKRILGFNSFGELGFNTYGKPLKICILISILISQIGFVATYILFTASNITSFLSNLFNYNINTANVVLLQCFLLIPLVLIRNLTKLSLTSLISSIFILIGLIIIFYFSGLQLLENGLGPNIVNFNSKSWSMLIGVAVTSFEGIGLILPIESSMANPEKFPFVLLISMLFITSLFVAIGVIGYTAFGENVKSIIILNLPQSNFSVQSILILYSLAVFLTAPLQLFPAIKIGESILFNNSKTENNGKLYHNSGKYNPKVKWLKNIFRSIVVILICTIAYLNSNNIDKFVSLNGCFACIPLVYIYPPLIHLKTYKVKAQNDLQGKFFKVFDYILILVGILAVVYTTYQILFNN